MTLTIPVNECNSDITSIIPLCWAVAGPVDLTLAAETATCGGGPEIRRTPTLTRPIALAAAGYRQFRRGVSPTVQEMEETG